MVCMHTNPSSPPLTLSLHVFCHPFSFPREWLPLASSLAFGNKLLKSVGSGYLQLHFRDGIFHLLACVHACVRTEKEEEEDEAMVIFFSNLDNAKCKQLRSTTNGPAADGSHTRKRTRVYSMMVTAPTAPCTRIPKRTRVHCASTHLAESDDNISRYPSPT